MPLSLLQDGDWQAELFQLGCCWDARPQGAAPSPLPSLPFPTGDRAGICLRALGEGLTCPSGGFHGETAGDENEEPKKQKKEEGGKARRLPGIKKRLCKYMATYMELGLGSVRAGAAWQLALINCAF